MVSRTLFAFVILVATGVCRGDDEKALLAAIQAHPDEDTPRLAYADWLIENGQTESRREYGLFIKLQVELAAKFDVTMASQSKDVRAMESRIAVLLQRYASEWTPAQFHNSKTALAYEKVGPLDSRAEVIWRRGFIDRVVVPSHEIGNPDFWAAVDKLPALDFLHFGPQFQRADIEQIPKEVLARIRGVALDATYADDQVSSILGRMKNLQQLGLDVLGTSRLTRVSDILNSEHATSLRALSVSYTDARAIAGLFNSSRATRLETLSLGLVRPATYTPFSELPGFDSANNLPALRNLELAGLYHSEIMHFIHHPRFRELEQVKVVYDTPLHQTVLEEVAKNGEKLLHFNNFNLNESHLPPSLLKRLNGNRAKLCGFVIKAFLATPNY